MFFMTESGEMNNQIRKHKRREQSTGQKDRQFFVEVFSGQHSRGIQAPYEKTLRKIIIILGSSPDFAFFSQEERLQLLSTPLSPHPFPTGTGSLG